MIVPIVLVVDGPAVSATALLLGLADIVVMTTDSYAFVSGPKMVAEMTELKLKASDLAGCAEIRVMEFRSNPNPVMSPTTSEFIDALQREHTEVIGAAIECEQFWATRDVVSPSAALSATMLALA